MVGFQSQAKRGAKKDVIGVVGAASVSTTVGTEVQDRAGLSEL